MVHLIFVWRKLQNDTNHTDKILVNVHTNKKLTPKNPDFKLLNQLIKKFKVPIIAEGRFNTPVSFKKAMKSGAHAVVVGTALNRIELITKSFLDEI